MKSGSFAFKVLIPLLLLGVLFLLNLFK